MSGGYEKYLCNVLPRMAKHDDVEAILCILPDSVNLSISFDPMSKVKFMSCKPFNFLMSLRNTALLQELKKFSPDVIFVPIERSFRYVNVPIVNMVQNMEPFVANIHGDPWGERLKKFIQSLVAKHAMKKADHVIAISKFVSDFIMTTYSISNEKNSIIYHGVDVKKIGDGYKPDIFPEGWYDKFIFTAGSIRPARGLEDLLLAMKHLASQGIDTVRLVIGGGTNGSSMIGYQKKLKNWIQTNNLSGRIYWAGHLNEDEMTWCYRNCNAFVMTSRIEACSNIAIESMSHGCICISSDNQCLPEIFGNTAIYYPSKDGQFLAETIQTVLTWDDDQRKIMSEKARRQAANFSWDICAEKTLAVLAKAAKNFNR